METVRKVIENSFKQALGFAPTIAHACQSQMIHNLKVMAVAQNNTWLAEQLESTVSKQHSEPIQLELKIE